ncbi:serine/threonine-protein kinase [Streptomyces sp. NPDC059175]|uniref:serine/threonine-protein kinase n=1 Tax=unclassified Streptomyces TaxID=2593676 RepID=UPI0036AAE110
MEQLASGDPHRIGAYRLLARLGAGGMGRVYLARSDRGRTVAVKLVRRELAEQEEFRSRFRQEVAAARRVGGTWTAPVLDADTEAAVPWVATGYIAGPSLHAVVSGGPGPGHGPLPERSVRALAAGLARALRDIHSAGIVHRDLKPSNVLVTIDGPRVIDFGIARALETVTDGGLTRTGALVGSPGFMAPEQVRGERITPACDVFCLGSVLAYAATGRLPFGSADSGVHALMFRIAEEAPDLSDVPDGLRELVQDCLHKDPDERPGLGQVLARAGAAEGSTVPWLPGPLIAQLGSHAVRLLEVEHPENLPDPMAARGAPSAPAAGAAGGGRGAPGAPGTPGVHALPTRAGSPMPPHGPLPPHTTAPSYGSVHPHGHAVTPPPPWSPAGHQAGYTTPYGPPAPEPPARGIRGTVALVAVAVVVAVAAGTSVYALMNNSGHAKAPTASGSTGSAAPDAPESPTPRTEGGGSGTSPSPASGTGAVPEEYVGTWRASFTTSDGSTNTRVMTIAQGSSGTTVMTLTGQGAAYECRWSATLQASGPPLELGPTQVTFGDRRSCSPGQWSRLDMPDDRTIVRELVGSGGAPLTYTKVG